MELGYVTTYVPQDFEGSRNSKKVCGSGRRGAQNERLGRQAGATL